MSAWIELALWLRFIFFYLSEISQFFWINELILSSILASRVFLIVYICGVTAFAGSYNSLNQGMFLEKGLTRQDIDASFLTNYEQWQDFWQISFKASLGDFPDDWGNA